MGKFSKSKDVPTSEPQQTSKPSGHTRPNPGIFENGAHKDKTRCPTPDPSRPNPGIFEKRSADGLADND